MQGRRQKASTGAMTSRAAIKALVVVNCISKECGFVALWSLVLVISDRPARDLIPVDGYSIGCVVSDVAFLKDSDVNRSTSQLGSNKNESLYVFCEA
jgi:hypothetical protein